MQTPTLDTSHGSPASHPAVLELERFQLIQNPWLRTVVFILPFLLVFFLLLDWLLGWNTFARDTLRLTAILVAIVDLLILSSLFRSVPAAFRSIWMQGLVQPGEDESSSVASQVSFIRSFQAAVNSRWSWLVGFLLAALVFFTSLTGLAILGIYKGPYTPGELLTFFFFGRLGFIGPILGFIIGLLVWRVIIIAYTILLFGRIFTIDMNPGHPDGCGGLKPLGNLCLSIAFIILVPAIFLSFWGIGVTLVDIPGASFFAENWSDTFRKLLILLSASAFFLFFLPLYYVHLEMARRQTELRDELDRLSLKIGQLREELRLSADTGDMGAGSQKLDALAFMEKVYQVNSEIPTWPFDTRMVWRFAAGQAVPLLTLLGTSPPVTGLVESLIKALSQ